MLSKYFETNYQGSIVLKRAPRVLAIDIGTDGVSIAEDCDGYFWTEFTHAEAIEMLDELKAMIVEQMMTAPYGGKQNRS